MADTIQTTRGIGSPPGRNGEDGVGIALIEQIDAVRIRITLTNRAIYSFSLPRGLPGDPGENGVNPILVGGQVILRPYGTQPKIQIDATGLPNVFSINLYMPDPSASAEAANQSAGQAQTAAQTATSAAATVTSAAAGYADFRTKYLGAFEADPQADNAGGALIPGALYFRTGSSPGMRAYTGSSWLMAYATITGAVASFNGRQGAVAPETNDYSFTQISGKAAAAQLPAATTAALGAVELATSAEAAARTDTSRAVTPAGVAAAIAAVGGLFDVYVDEFPVSGTWTKRPGAALVFGELLGGGQGGGAGNQSGSGPNILGGTPGVGGDAVSYLFLAADLPATAPVSVGAGGVGSVAIQQSTTVPASPTPGGDTLFGSPILLRARGGANGNSGSLTGYDGVIASLGGPSGIPARNASTNGNSTAGASSYRGGGGGGGGGCYGSAAQNKGGAGGAPNLDQSTLGGGGLGGAVDQPGGNGGDHQGGGGGGGALGIGTTTAGRGGDGGRGGGGGGGGAGRNASTSSTRYFGSGGNGGPGYARITTLVQRVN